MMYDMLLFHHVLQDPGLCPTLCLPSVLLAALACTHFVRALHVLGDMEGGGHSLTLSWHHINSLQHEIHLLPPPTNQMLQEPPETRPSTHTSGQSQIHLQ